MDIKSKVQPYLEFCQYRKELSVKTLKAYRVDLRQFFEFMKEEEPDKVNIEEYITKLHKEFKQGTVKRKIASVKAFYNYLEEEEVIENSPFRKIRVKFKEVQTLPKIIPRDEIEQLLDFMYSLKRISGIGNKYILRDIAIIEVLFMSGARVHEISNMRLEDMNLDTGVIKIMGKGGKERYTAISSDEILALLKEYYENNKKIIEKSGYFFVNRLGKRYTEDSIRIMLKKHVKSSGIRRNITPHMFRHSCATYLIEEGVDISYVQRIMGHSSIKTTQIYIHVAIKEQLEILRDRHPRKVLKIPHAA